MERVITCPNCFDNDKCFEDMQEEFNSYLCFSCGYMSDSRYKKDSINLIESLKRSPKLVQETQFYDKERNIVWFLSILNMGELGVIYPEGDEKDYVWKYAKLVDIPEDERANYDGHEKRLDVDNATTYNKENFLQACKDMGITKQIG
tara:strand:+ start:269 stop:709 length:441 start_codon:yes stop_codon:yes gene_type:complete